MEIFKSNKGVDKISFRGYAYRRNTTNITTQSWRCDHKSCPGTVSTDIHYKAEGVVPVEKRSHNHPPDPARIELLVAIDRMVETASRNRDPPERIISNTSMILTEEARSIAPKTRAIAAKIKRRRRRLESKPKMISKFQFPEEFKSVKLTPEDFRFLIKQHRKRLSGKCRS